MSSAVGIDMQMVEEGIEVTHVDPNGPSFPHLQAGDVIKRVDGMWMAGKSIEQVCDGNNPNFLPLHHFRPFPQSLTPFPDLPRPSHSSAGTTARSATLPCSRPMRPSLRLESNALWLFPATLPPWEAQRTSTATARWAATGRQRSWNRP